VIKIVPFPVSPQRTSVVSPRPKESFHQPAKLCSLFHSCLSLPYPSVLLSEDSTLNCSRLITFRYQPVFCLVLDLSGGVGPGIDIPVTSQPCVRSHLSSVVSTAIRITLVL